MEEGAGRFHGASFMGRRSPGVRESMDAYFKAFLQVRERGGGYQNKSGPETEQGFSEVRVGVVFWAHARGPRCVPGPDRRDLR